jgi:8-oxo-dGTP pyrophosphatase MutT (NUDIX family)
MSEKRFTLRCAVYLFVFKNDKILLLRRFNTGWMDGKYSLIAGHIDGNETVFEAMIREAFEEARIKIDIRDLEPATVLHRKSTDQEYIDFFFVARKWEGKPVIGEPNKCDDLKWFPLNALPNNLLPHVKQALDNYNNKVPFSVSGWK